jgi:hypothetical protein
VGVGVEVGVGVDFGYKLSICAIVTVVPLEETKG